MSDDELLSKLKGNEEKKLREGEGERPLCFCHYM